MDSLTALMISTSLFAAMCLFALYRLYRYPNELPQQWRLTLMLGMLAVLTLVLVRFIGIMHTIVQLSEVIP